jgi:recombinational DNA repair protein RecT
MNQNYSFQTSMPAYLENKENSKERQCEKVLNAVRNGADNLLQISERIGIPQAIVSARCADLKSEKKIEYCDFVIYKDRKRKKIQLYKPKPLIQSELF